MCECANNVTLDNKILTRFYKEVEELHKQNTITDEDVLLAHTSEMAMMLLESKTFNDESLYTDTTTAEILDEIDQKRNAQILEQATTIDTHHKNISKLSLLLSRITYWGLFIILMLLFWLYKTTSIASTKWYTWIILCIPMFWGALCHAGIIPPKGNIIRYLEKVYNNFLYNRLNKK